MSGRRKEIKPRNQDRYPTFTKMTKAAVASFQNGMRLYHDSILLLENDRFPTSLQIGVLSIEEFGKYWALSDFVFYSEGHRDPKILREFLNLTFAHRFKQSKYINTAFCYFDIRFRKILEEKTLEPLKQKATYVNIGGARGSDFCGHVQSPMSITKGKAIKVISMVHEFLLETAIRVKGGEDLDEDEVNEILGQDTIDGLIDDYQLLKYKPHELSVVNRYLDIK